MNEKIVQLALPSGLASNGTREQNEGRWYAGSLVRFSEGRVMPVGGWTRATYSTGTTVPALTGEPRAIYPVRDNAGKYRVVIGTTSKLYSLDENATNDITPAGGITTLRQDAVYSGTGATADYGTTMSPLAEADSWSLDFFGDKLVAISTADKTKLWYQSGAVTDPLTALFGAPFGRALVATPERFLFVLGADDNERKIRWASQETLTDWTPADTNTAGDFTLATTGRLMTGRRTRGQTLLFTDTDLHAATYIGGTFVYRFDLVGEQCGVISRNAVAMVNSTAYWMGNKSFYSYDGFVKPVQCDVADRVFSDINYAQLSKVWSMSIVQHGEIWWFYPSAASLNCDRYVVYNYKEGHWSYGALSRSAGADAGALRRPLMAHPLGELWEHEILGNTVAATPYVESGPIKLGDGDTVYRVQRFIPDEGVLGHTRVTFFTSMWPTGAETTHGPYSMAAPTNVRLTGRYVRVKIEQVVETPNGWRFGKLLLGVVPGGRR